MNEVIVGMIVLGWLVYAWLITKIIKMRNR